MPQLQTRKRIFMLVVASDLERWWVLLEGDSPVSETGDEDQINILY